MADAQAELADLESQIRAILGSVCRSLAEIDSAARPGHVVLAEEASSAAGRRITPATVTGWLGRHRVPQAPRSAADRRAICEVVGSSLGGAEAERLSELWERRDLLLLTDRRRGETNRGELRRDPDQRVRSQNALDLAEWLGSGVPPPLAADLDLSGYFRLASTISGGRVPPYVPRDIDDLLLERLAAAQAASEPGQRLVLLAGPPKSGKTRTLLHNVIKLAPASRVLIMGPPVPYTNSVMTVARLLRRCDRELGAGDIFFLIDDLQAHLESGLNLPHLLEYLALTPRRPVLLATVHQSIIDNESIAGDSVNPLSRDLVASAAIRLTQTLNMKELAAASHVLPHLGQESLAKLAPYLAAVPALVRRAESAMESLDFRSEAAIIRGTLTATLVEHDRSISERLILRLAKAHSDMADAGRPLDDGELRRSLYEWAAEPMGGSYPLVLRERDRWRLMDGVEDALLRSHYVPQPVLDQLGLGERLDIAIGLGRLGRLEEAIAVYESVWSATPRQDGYQYQTYAKANAGSLCLELSDKFGWAFRRDDEPGPFWRRKGELLLYEIGLAGDRWARRRLAAESSTLLPLPERRAWLVEAVHDQDIRACYIYGRILATEDPASAYARDLLLRAARAGHTEAAYLRAGLADRDGELGLGILLLLRLANSGESDAMHLLAFAYTLDGQLAEARAWRARANASEQSAGRLTGGAPP